MELVNAKILESSNEFLSNFEDLSQLQHLGFIEPQDPNDEDEPNYPEMLDEFIEKITLLLLSLLEGAENSVILTRMANTIMFNAVKDRMVNVFGKFLHRLDIFPKVLLKNQD